MQRFCQTVLIVLSLLLVSCGQVALYSDLDEEEANEIMAHLLERNIGCSKLAGKEGKWVLQVAPDEFPVAMQTLQAVGLPREKFQRMGDIFQKTGLVSSPTEERIRFISALSQEISGTLMKIDGVLAARVHIALPNNDPLSDKTTPPSAAVFIKYRAGYDIESAMPDLKNLVSRSIEGLQFENVQLVMTQADAAPQLTKVIRESWLTRLPPWALPAGSAAAGFVVAAGLFFMVRKRQATS